MFDYARRKSAVVQIGNTPLGGENPIRIQSMANVSTMETNDCVEQAIRIIKAGADYVRFTTQGKREAVNLGEIRKILHEKGFLTPLIADVHFNASVADEAAERVDKVRINPGNYVDKIKTFNLVDYTDEEYDEELHKIRNRFVPFLNICREHSTAIRLGVNHGSLSDRIMSRYGDTPEGMVASCMEFLRIARDENFPNVVISIKSSNSGTMVRTVRLLVQTMDKEDMHYPLHLGVTEAGEGEDGRIKSAVGIGTLLAEGIGDTIRVSLSEEPEEEIPVAQKLVKYILERKGHPHIEGQIFSGFDPIHTTRRISRKVENIGGSQVPVVVSDRTTGDVGFELLSRPDYVYIGKEDPQNMPESFRLIVDFDHWKELPNAFPLFNHNEMKLMKECQAAIKFVRLEYADLSDETIDVLQKDSAAVLILKTQHQNGFGEQTAAMHKLGIAGCNVPVVISRNYKDKDVESLELKASADMGALFINGFGDGIMLRDENMQGKTTDHIMFAILQATRARITRAEFISCPGCGRTLYDLQSTIAHIKENSKNLNGLKIGIMGCIVNGPGEMADADYGYVGAGRGLINLYKGKECVKKNIPEDEAVEQLTDLIKENGDWKD